MKKVRVLDFDGVVVPGSETVKQQAWDSAFGKRGEQFCSLLAQARSHYAGRGDRFDILTSVHEALGKSTEEARRCAQEDAVVFAQTIAERILKLGVSEQTKAALQSLSELGPLYLNSTTPTKELIERVRVLGIGEYFTDILGSDHTKVENLHIIAQREGVSPQQIIFLGDAESDRKAAEEFGCLFVGFVNDSTNDWRNSPQKFPVINTVADLL